jgi:hypothetical protein
MTGGDELGDDVAADLPRSEHDVAAHDATTDPFEATPRTTTDCGRG